MLLSVDWDAFSGTRELVFDAPIWGTRDQEFDRLEVWRERVQKRGGTNWDVLDDDFPLYPGWERLKQYAGVPAFVALSHAEAWAWLEQYPGQDVVNIDSHHDLYSLSGDPARVRPGNWAGLGLKAGLIGSYTCQYPEWHAELPVAEGYDLTRTWEELLAHLAPEVLPRVQLKREAGLPNRADIQSVLLVQSPAWTNPAHDRAFNTLSDWLGSTPLTVPMGRHSLG